MEKVALNNLQLDHLAQSHPALSKVFYGTVACDQLPSKLIKEGPSAYIVNTDPQDEPGTHWISLWTDGNTCEIMDSYAVSLDVYGTTKPLKDWLDRHFKYQVANGKTLQSLFSQSCGDYALMFLVDKAEGRSMNDFLNRFKKRDFVGNDRKVGQWLRNMVVDELEWKRICESTCHQGTCSKGIYHLLHLY